MPRLPTPFQGAVQRADEALIAITRMQVKALRIEDAGAIRVDNRVQEGFGELPTSATTMIASLTMHDNLINITLTHTFDHRIYELSKAIL